MHAPPQNSVFSGHRHALFMQTWPPPHAGVQTAEGATHLPCEQRSVAAHATPQAPQFAESFSVSTQPLAHELSVLGHTHWPVTQLPVPQLLPHTPQLRGSVCGFEQPLVHCTWPALHASAADPAFVLGRTLAGGCCGSSVEQADSASARPDA